MWIYEQATGEMNYSPDGVAAQPITKGYSGFGVGKDNPNMEHVRDVGPIPRGSYAIGPAHSDPEKGPMVMALVPRADTSTFGRGGFLIHGDSLEHPGEASHGCIILDRVAREAIAASPDRTLQVV